MDVHASPKRNGQEGHGENLPVGHNNDDIRVERLADRKGRRISDLLGLVNGKMMGHRQGFNRRGSSFLSPSPGAIRLSDDAGDRVLRIQ